MTNNTMDKSQSTPHCGEASAQMKIGPSCAHNLSRQKQQKAASTKICPRAKLGPDGNPPAMIADDSRSMFIAASIPRCTTSRNLCRFRMHIAALSACSCHVSIFVTTLSARHSERVRLKQRLARSLRSQRLDTNADSKAPTHDMTHRPHARRGDGDACEYGGDGDPHEQATGAMSRFEISKAKQTEKNGLHMEQYMYVKDITVSTTNPHVQARDFYTHKSF